MYTLNTNFHKIYLFKIHVFIVKVYLSCVDRDINAVLTHFMVLSFIFCNYYFFIATVVHIDMVILVAL